MIKNAAAGEIVRPAVAAASRLPPSLNPATRLNATASAIAMKTIDACVLSSRSSSRYKMLLPSAEQMSSFASFAVTLCSSSKGFTSESSSEWATPLCQSVSMMR